MGSIAKIGFKALPLMEFFRERVLEIHFRSTNNHSSNSDVERLHITINEHIRLLRDDPDKEIDTVEEKLNKIITFYNGTIYVTSGCRPSDFINGKITQDNYPLIEGKLQKSNPRRLRTS